MLRMLLEAGAVDPNERDPMRDNATLLHLVRAAH